MLKRSAVSITAFYDVRAIPLLDDIHWLTGAHARPWLERAARRDMSLVALAKWLRANLSPERTHLVLELVQLRRQAAIKFDRAAEMFFTRRGLEQATDERIAAYKAERFPAGGPLADLCCGIGGDLLGLARRAEVIGVDRDPAMCLVAEANGRVYGHEKLSIRNADVAQLPLGDLAAWHLDPDRRPGGRRSACPWWHEPDPGVVDQIRRGLPDGAVKLAPAAQLPTHWSEEAELEWIGHHRQCQQLVVWFGQLARHPGQPVATVLAGHARTVRTITGGARVAICPSPQPRRFVFEPHSAVLAARLTGVLAAQHHLAALAADLSLLTGDHPVADPALASFEVSDILPIDIKRIKSVLRQRRIGRLEVKKRGVPHDPAIVRRRLCVPGDNQATLLLTRIHDRPRALLGRRLA